MKRTKISYSVERELTPAAYQDGDSRYAAMRAIEARLADELAGHGYELRPGKFPEWSLFGRWNGLNPLWREYTWPGFRASAPDLLKLVLTAPVYARVDATPVPV